MNDLVRYDPKRGCFVLAGNKKKYWPGTNIVKSTGNAFDWRAPKQIEEREDEMPGVRRVERSQRDT